MAKLRGHGRVVEHRVISLLCLGGRDIANGFEQAAMVETSLLAQPAPGSQHDPIVQLRSAAVGHSQSEISSFRLSAKRQLDLHPRDRGRVL